MAMSSVGVRFDGGCQLDWAKMEGGRDFMKLGCRVRSWDLLGYNSKVEDWTLKF